MEQRRISTIHDPRYRQLVAKLVQSRKKIRVSQEKLASYLGLTQPDISKIERCERRLDVLELLDWSQYIAKQLGVPVDFFFEEIYDHNSRPQFSKANLNQFGTES